MWVTNLSSNTLMKLRLSDGAILGTYPTASGPQTIAFDGANMWVTSYYTASASKM
jgi:hypothetical protein